jgi:hypothetical protein
VPRPSSSSRDIPTGSGGTVSQATDPAAAGPEGKDEPPGQDRGFPWQPFVEIAAAAAGILLLIQLVGGAIMWARFRALELPAARGVSLLSPEYLQGVGTSALFWSLMLALVAVALLHVIRRLLSDGLGQWAAPIVALMLELALVVAVLGLPLSGQQRVLAVATGLVAGAAFVALDQTVGSKPRVGSKRRVSLGLLFLVALVGGTLGFIRAYGPPAKLELVFVFLKEGEVTSGAYIGANSDEVFLAPDSFNHTYGQIVGIPRDDIVRVSFAEPQNFRAAGARDPRSLLDPSQSSPGGLQEEVEEYFAAWAGDPRWKYPPISFLESESFLRTHVDEFFPTTEQRWKEAGDRVPLTRLVNDARGYSGRALITHGRVLQALRVPVPGTAARITHFLTLTDQEGSRSRVLCGLITRSSRRFPEGSEVEVRGVVVTSGSLAVASGADVQGAFMQCSAARLRPAPRPRARRAAARDRVGPPQPQRRSR